HGPILVLCHVLFWSSAIYLSVTVGALASRAYLIGTILRGVGALPMVGRRLRIDPAHVRAFEDAIHHALTNRPSARLPVLVLDCVAQTILVIEIYWTIRSTGTPIAAGTALSVEVITKAANVIQFVGVTEAAYAVIFNWLGMTAAVGFTLALVKLLRSL